MLKEQADSCRSDVEKQSERKAKLEIEMAQLEGEMRDLETKLEQLHAKHREADKVKQDVHNKKLRLDELKRNRRDLESEITRRLPCDETLLEEEIQKFQLTKVSFTNILISVSLVIIALNRRHDHRASGSRICKAPKRSCSSRTSG